LDSDLASIYGVETKALNRAVKRNRDRFPQDFVFQLSEDEWKNLRYQIGTSSLGHGGRRRPPYVFTEHGAIMAANVLNSQRAVQMSVFVVRAFLKMRALLGDKRELAQKLASLEKELKKRLDVHRSRHRYHFTTCDGHNRSTSSARTTEAAYWFYTITDPESPIIVLATLPYLPSNQTSPVAPTRHLVVRRRRKRCVGGNI
jgi:phage regulator Rha-like protein